MSARHFGLTTRSASGAQPPSGPLPSADTTRADNVIQLAGRSSPARLNSRSKEVEPFFDHREFGSCVLFFFVVTAPAVLVTAAVVGYALFIAEPI